MIGRCSIGNFHIFRLQGLLVGKSAEPDLRKLIDELIAERDQIETVLNTITLQMGPKVMLAAKIVIKSDTSVGEDSRRSLQRHGIVGRSFRTRSALLWTYLDQLNSFPE